MRFPPLLLMFLALNMGRAAPVALSPQLITLPDNAGPVRFVDIDGDGRSDLLAIDLAEKKLWNFHQRPSGFTNSPDQVIALPPRTAWVAVADVDPHSGLELLMSTATGLFYSRQDHGLFEAERRPLILANQVFTNSDFPILTMLTTNTAGTNDSIPVITATQVVLYRRNSAYEWSPGPPLALDDQEAGCHVNRDQWTMGASPAHSLRTGWSFLAKPDQPASQEAENEAVRKIRENFEKSASAWPAGEQRVDIEGNGLEDLVLWQVGTRLDFKSDLYFFRRGADQRLSDLPTQILHSRGFPIPGGSVYYARPLHDLQGDGHRELVLLEPKTVFMSPGGLIDMFLTHGVEWLVTIRVFQHGAFSHSPDASIPVRMILSLEDLGSWPICIEGDFNGDGRPDLLVRRSETQWNIFFSATDRRWFEPQPALTFDAPANGYFQIQDLNGDGLSDIIWREWDKSNLRIFMSPPRPAKDRNP